MNSPEGPRMSKESFANSITRLIISSSISMQIDTSFVIVLTCDIRQTPLTLDLLRSTAYKEILFVFYSFGHQLQCLGERFKRVNAWFTV